MKKFSSIRIFFLICVVVCTGSFLLGYLIHSQVIGKREHDLLLKDRNSELVEEQKKNENLKAESSSVEESPLESMSILNAHEYVLMEEEGYIAVYYADKKTLYSETDIRVAELPVQLQNEIKQGKYIYTVEELYDFLESHSS